jgi:nicotinamide-nucleotide adenylyltransferase
MEGGYPVESVRLFERQTYASTFVREKMLRDEDWTSLVPKAVADFILKIDGVNRLKDLAQTDKV